MSVCRMNEFIMNTVGVGRFIGVGDGQEHYITFIDEMFGSSEGRFRMNQTSSWCRGSPGY